MTWTRDNYPTEFEGYTEVVRNKLIEVANRLIDEEGEEDVAAAAQAITLVKAWADENGIEMSVSEH